MKFHYYPGATPIDLDEAEGLIPEHITLQSELNEWEQEKHYQSRNLGIF